MPKSISKLVAAILISQCAGLIGALFTTSAINNWYNYLNLPYFRPPNSVFGPVWTVLYTLIGISLYWIWIQPQSKMRSDALRLFVIHLVLNTFWSIIFFGAQQIFSALIIIVFMVITLIIIMKKFLRIDTRAALILIPYLAWISFATLLNFAIWRLN